MKGERGEWEGDSPLNHPRHMETAQAPLGRLPGEGMEGAGAETHQGSPWISEVPTTVTIT